MTLRLTIPTELAERLRFEAERKGEKKEEVALRLLDQHLPPVDAARRASAVAMLQRWSEEDASLSPEELAGNAAVLRTLDDDRPSYRKLFADLSEDDSKCFVPAKLWHEISP